MVGYKDREAKARIHGVQAQMQTFGYFFGLRLGFIILGHSDNLSMWLQAKNLCAAEAQKIAKSTVSPLKKLRSDDKFNLFWKDVENKAAIIRCRPSEIAKKEKITS